MTNKEKRVEQNTSMNNKGIMLLKKKIGAVLTAVLLVCVVFYTAGCTGKDTAELNGSQFSGNSQEAMDFSGAASGDMDIANAAGENVVEISDESAPPASGAAGDSDDKMVMVSFENAGRANPFLPVGETKQVTNKELFDFELIEPPTNVQPDSHASKIVTTKISGIMFDNYNPSAILNIEGNDYLVRSGDVINGYKILAISPSTVTVQLGSNVYKAGVGEVVGGYDAINFNSISNLSSKFGGNTGNKK